MIHGTRGLLFYIPTRIFISSWITKVVCGRISINVQSTQCYLVLYDHCFVLFLAVPHEVTECAESFNKITTQSDNLHCITNICYISIS